MRRTFNRVTSIALLTLSFILCVVLLGSAPVNASSSDMISTLANPERCLTADGSPLSGVPARMLTCRGLATQQWQIDADGKWHVQADTNYCLALDSDIVWFNKLVVLPCTHSRVRGFTAEVQPDNTVLYGITTTNGVYDLALDSGRADRQLYLYYKGLSNLNQRWRWFQQDLSLAQSSGCTITYPFPATDTLTYQRELACDRVAKVQPPYTIPANVVRDPSVFPGSVPSSTANVSQTFSFNLFFKNQSYLRIKFPTANWLNTGLYALPNQTVRIVVSNATSTDLQGVSAQIGVHTDRLSPTSSNVLSSGFLRYPNVVLNLPLQVGENLMRSPYGGPIVLVSNSSVNTTIQVTIDNAVQSPYFKAGTTTPAEWLARRSAPTPYGSLESDLAVVYMPASELSQLSYEDALAIAQYYSTIGSLHNQLSGLSSTDTAFHQPPQGQYWHVADKQITSGAGHSGFPMMYFNSWNLGTPNDTIYRSNGWGVYHELGHDYQMGAWAAVYGTEVTNNLFSLHAQEQLFGNSALINDNVYAQAIEVLNNAAITDKWNYDADQNGQSDPFRQLVFLDQIRLGFPELNWQIWTQLMRRYRELSDTEYSALDTDQLKRDRFMTLLCDITNSNLTPHFEAWTIPITTEAKNSCAAYPPLKQEIWHIDGSQPRLEGNGEGRVVRNYWKNLKASSLQDLTNLPTYPNAPTGSDVIIHGLESPQNWGDTYGQRVRGYLLPPVTGDYRFWLSGDDIAQFRLSPNQNPAQTVSLLTLTTASGYRKFDRYPTSVQRSQPVRLEAGKTYYFEVLHIEQGGGDSVSVAWEIPATATSPAEPRKLIAARFLAPLAPSRSLPLIDRP